MMKNPREKAIELAKSQNYVPWLILGALAHILVLAWTAFTTPRMPIAVDEQSPTGEKDHNLFETEFRRAAKQERDIYAWRGAIIGGPLQTLAAIVSIAASLANAPTAGFEPQQAGNATTEAVSAAGDGGNAAPATAPETEESTAEATGRTWLRNLNSRGLSLLGRDDAEENERLAGGLDVLERLAPEDWTWTEPTGIWRGSYKMRSRTRSQTVEIDFGEPPTTHYPDSRCAGTLRPTGRPPSFGEGRQYRETLVQGRRRCLDNGLVSIRPGEDGRLLYFEWIVSNGSRRRVWEGTLVRLDREPDGEETGSDDPAPEPAGTPRTAPEAQNGADVR